MRQGRALIWALLAGLLTGCAWGAPARSTTWLRPLQQFEGPAGADIIQMEVVLLERPIGDSYINHELWRMADEQVVPLERKAALEENGFRVGQIGGLTPVGLQNLLTSERSCVNPRRHYIHAGNPRVLAFGPLAPLCQFQMQIDGQATHVSLQQAVCSVSVLPTLADKGMLRLQFTPQVEYGETKFEPQPSEDNSSLILQQKRPSKSFPALSWEVTLGPNQYIIVGARDNQANTLGAQCFIRRDESVPVQWLLVIRAWPAATGSAADVSCWAEDEEPGPLRTSPLALQASWRTARGASR